MAIQWSLVLFTVFGGLGCWCFVCVAIDQFAQKAEKAVFPASIISLVALIVGGLCSVAHLSHPTRIIEALSVPTSSIFMEGAGIFILAAIIIVFLILYKREANTNLLKGVAVVGAIVAVALTFIMGHSYIMPVREAWNTIALPIGYVGTSMVLGVSAFAALAAFRKTEGVGFYSLLTAIAGVVALLTVVFYAASAGIIADGDVALLLWGGVVVVGCVLPALCGFVARTNEKSALILLVVALICACVGTVAFRVLMWTVGVATVDFFGASL